VCPKQKRKLRSLQSLLRDAPDEQSSSNSEDGDGDILIESSESGKSPCATGSDD
jgi:hypothetical protein